MSIKEIAKRAQVSPATVSRVLNNPDYKCSSPQVRERIRKAAIELNYVPNEAARRLKTGISAAEEKTCYINILMTRTDSAHVDPFLMNCCELWSLRSIGITVFCRRYGTELFFPVTRGVEEKI